MRGGMTSLTLQAVEPAVWVVLCQVLVKLRLTTRAKTVEMQGKVYKEGDWISLNGSTGEVYDGQVPQLRT